MARGDPGRLSPCSSAGGSEAGTDVPFCIFKLDFYDVSLSVLGLLKKKKKRPQEQPPLLRTRITQTMYDEKIQLGLQTVRKRWLRITGKDSECNHVAGRHLAPAGSLFSSASTGPLLGLHLRAPAVAPTPWARPWSEALVILSGCWDPHSSRPLAPLWLC